MYKCIQEEIFWLLIAESLKLFKGFIKKDLLIVGTAVNEVLFGLLFISYEANLFVVPDIFNYVILSDKEGKPMGTRCGNLLIFS